MMYYVLENFTIEVENIIGGITLITVNAHCMRLIITIASLGDHNYYPTNIP